MNRFTANTEDEINSFIEGIVKLIKYMTLTIFILVSRDVILRFGERVTGYIYYIIL